MQDVITAISEAQTSASGGAPGIVRFGPGLQSLRIDQPVTLAELRRHKRAFLKLATKVLFARLQDGGTAARMFIDYLVDNISGAIVCTLKKKKKKKNIRLLPQSLESFLKNNKTKWNVVRALNTLEQKRIIATRHEARAD